MCSEQETYRKTRLQKSWQTSVHNGENQILVDGTMHLFNNEYNPNVDEQDVKKMANSSENISLQGNKYPLIIDRRPFATEGDSLYYLLRGLAKTIHASGSSVSDGCR